MFGGTYETVSLVPAPSTYGHVADPGHKFPRVESVNSVQLPWSDAVPRHNDRPMQTASCLMDV